MVDVIIACEELGVSRAAICTSAKYKDFYRKSSKTKRDAKFDLQGFIKYSELQEELVEKTKLFTEYLHKIESISYPQIAKISGVAGNNINKCIYGYDAALKISISFRTNHPLMWDRFHKYYGWKTR